MIKARPQIRSRAPTAGSSFSTVEHDLTGVVCDPRTWPSIREPPLASPNRPLLSVRFRPDSGTAVVPARSRALVFVLVMALNDLVNVASPLPSPRGRRPFYAHFASKNTASIQEPARNEVTKRAAVASLICARAAAALVSLTFFPLLLLLLRLLPSRAVISRAQQQQLSLREVKGREGEDKERLFFDELRLLAVAGRAFEAY